MFIAKTLATIQPSFRPIEPPQQRGHILFFALHTTK